MLSFIITYVILGLGTLAVLAHMILAIGKIVGECPQTSTAARSASVTIATGYAAIGAGGVLIIAAALPMLHQNAMEALLAALGLAAICLGLGFTHAVTTLRAVVRDQVTKTDAAPPAEPLPAT